jgi:hypothetical protein
LRLRKADSLSPALILDSLLGKFVLVDLMHEDRVEGGHGAWLGRAKLVGVVRVGDLQALVLGMRKMLSYAAAPLRQVSRLWRMRFCFNSARSDKLELSTAQGAPRRNTPPLTSHCP